MSTSTCKGFLSYGDGSKPMKLPYDWGNNNPLTNYFRVLRVPGFWPINHTPLTSPFKGVYCLLSNHSVNTKQRFRHFNIFQPPAKKPNSSRILTNAKFTPKNLPCKLNNLEKMRFSWEIVVPSSFFWGTPGRLPLWKRDTQTDPARVGPRSREPLKAESIFLRREGHLPWPFQKRHETWLFSNNEV